MNERQILEVNWKIFWQFFVFLIILLVLFLARKAFGVLLIAIVISLGLEPLISFLERKRVNRLLGALIVFLLTFFLIGLVFYLIIPSLIVDISGFIEHFNKIIVSTFGIGLPQNIVKNFSLSFDKAFSFLSAVNVSITGALTSVINKAVLILATLMISFYLTIEKGGTEKLLRVILPDIYEKSTLDIFNAFRIKIRRWFAAQLGLSLVIGVIVSIGLWLLGVRYPLILGIIAALFELVPVIGPILSGVIAFLVASTDSLSLGLYALLFFFIVQQIENHILVPIVMGKTVGVHPVIVIISLLAGAQIAGFVGIILSVPAAVIAQEIFAHLAKEKANRASSGIGI